MSAQLGGFMRPSFGQGFDGRSARIDTGGDFLNIGTASELRLDVCDVKPNNRIWHNHVNTPIFTNQDGECMFHTDIQYASLHRHSKQYPKGQYMHRASGS